MSADQQLEFVVQRAQNLQTALFTDLRDTSQKFRTSIIQLLDADEQGRLVFTLCKPYRDISGMAQVFPAQLQFFHKQKPYYLIVDGTAMISEGKGSWQDGAKVQVALTIQHATYRERKAEKRFKFASLLRQTASWFISEKIFSAAELYFN